MITFIVNKSMLNRYNHNYNYNNEGKENIDFKPAQK